MRNPIKDKVASLVMDRAPQLALLLAGEARHRFDVSVGTDLIEIAEKATDRSIRISREIGPYLPEMVRLFDFYHASVEPIRVRSRGQLREVVDFSTPRFHKVAGFDDFPVFCPSIAEPYATALVYADFADLREGGVVLDLGGYSGLTSIAFSKAVGRTGRVVVLEPDPANFAAARTNIDCHRRVNGIDNIELLPLAVSGETGFIEFSAEGSMGSGEAAIVGGYRGATMRVEAITLAALAERLGFAAVDFIKMDVEGAEQGVIAASGDFLLRYRPRLIIEPHLVDGVATDIAMRQVLSRLGYECGAMEQPGQPIALLTARPRAAGDRVH